MLQYENTHAAKFPGCNRVTGGSNQRENEFWIEGIPAEKLAK
jgi:hypothetical protein